MFKVKQEKNAHGNDTKKLDASSIQELYYMCDIKNLTSIVTHGILSHQRVDKLAIKHEDISNSAVQSNRSGKRIERPRKDKGPMRVHRFAPLYLNPHNAMLHNQRNHHETMCVLRINRAILNRSNVVLSDKNAASRGAKFFTPRTFAMESPESDYLSLPYGYVPSEQGTIAATTRMQARQAEALIPYVIQKEYITGIFVSGAAGKLAVEAELVPAELDDYEITIHPSLFFHGYHGWPPQLSPFKVDTTPMPPEACPPSPASSSSDGEDDDIYYHSLERSSPGSSSSQVWPDDAYLPIKPPSQVASNADDESDEDAPCIKRPRPRCPQPSTSSPIRLGDTESILFATPTSRPGSPLRSTSSPARPSNTDSILPISDTCPTSATSLCLESEDDKRARPKC